MAVGNDIRRRRFEHGEMTQRELAALVGVTRQTVNAIERGKYSPSLDVAFRIARVFGATVEDVFRYQPPADGHNRRDENPGSVRSPP